MADKSFASRVATWNRKQAGVSTREAVKWADRLARRPEYQPCTRCPDCGRPSRPTFAYCPICGARKESGTDE